MCRALWLSLIINLLIGAQVLSAIAGSGGSYWTIGELETFCKESGRCGERLCCEGKEVKIKGYLNGVNIFYGKAFPNVTQPKFQIIDGPGIRDSKNPWTTLSDSLEIYVVRGDIEALFERLIGHRELPLTLLCVKGTVRGFDAPTNSHKYRLYLLTVAAEDVSFDEGGCVT